MSNPQSAPSETQTAAVSKTLWIRRILLYVVGLFILTLGVSISIRSDLGVSPVSSVPLVLGRVLGVEVGNMTIVVFCAYVLIQIAILRKDFRWIQLLQVVCAVLFGKFVTLTSSLIAGWEPQSYLERLGMILLSTVVIAIGIKLYLTANLVPQASDGLVQTLCAKYHWKLANVKNACDLASVAVAASVSLLATGGLIGLREGTLITALGVGRVLWLINRWFGEKLQVFVSENPTGAKTGTVQ